MSKARLAPPLLRLCARFAWSTRWWSLGGVGMQRAIAEAMLRRGWLEEAIIVLAAYDGYWREGDWEGLFKGDIACDGKAVALASGQHLVGS